MTRVVVIPADETACGYYRMRLPAGVVRNARPDWEVEIYRPSDVQLATDAHGNLQYMKGIRDPQHIDLLVMQRVWSKTQFALIQAMQARGVAVVVDSDDAMWAIDKNNSAFKAWNDGVHSWRWTDAAAQIADMVTVTTPALARRYGKHGRVEVLPNCVPAEAESVDSIRFDLDQTPTIGWAGFTATHPGDLAVVGNAVQSAMSSTGCLARVIGDARGAARDWMLETGRVEKIEPVSIGGAYYTALTSLDIGLVPLRDTPFNRAKSYLKALEFAAAGVAVIASPTAANLELGKTVPISYARTPSEWLDKITQHVTNPGFHESRTRIARKAVFEHHTYEARALGWVSAWERAMNRRSKI